MVSFINIVFCLDYEIVGISIFTTFYNTPINFYLHNNQL